MFLAGDIKDAQQARGLRPNKAGEFGIVTQKHIIGDVIGVDGGIWVFDIPEN